MHLLRKLVRHPLKATVGAVAALVLAQLTVGTASATAITGSPGLRAAVLGGTTYLNAVAKDEPTNLWRLDDTAAATSIDSAGGDNLTMDASVTRGAAGPLEGESTPATGFSGSGSVPATTSRAITGPQSFSVEAWFRTTSTTGGKIIGFGNSRTGSSADYDRHLYLTNSGQLTFGVYPASHRILTSPRSYNDGQWHQAVAAMGKTGMDLFVDGRRVAQDTSSAGAEVFSGYWRIGGDNLSGWPSAPSKYSFAGTLADVAVYPAPLGLDQVKAHYVASGRSVEEPTDPTDPYAAAVRGDNPSFYWRLNEAKGTAVTDEVSGDTSSGTYVGSVVLGAPGSPAGPGGNAIRFPGTSGAYAVSNIQVNNPTVYSLETWFKTTSTQGGRLIGFGNARTGYSSDYDRHVYLLDSGRLRYGIYGATTTNIDSKLSYNDGLWHHLVATQGSGGQQLFVDGSLVAAGKAVDVQDYSGYWRLGTDRVWSGATSESPAASLDEAAVYPSVLSATAVAQHYRLGATIPSNQAPKAAFTSSVTKLKATFDASASTDADGTVAGYAWDFGDGTSGTGVTPSHTYAGPGSYAVVLTVKDDQGATSLATHEVKTTANADPAAAFSSECTDLDCVLDAGASVDPDGRIVSYAWDLGDGNTADTATVKHSFAAAGRYDVRLSVTDDDGARNTITQTVTVAARNNPPTAVATATCADLDCTFDGTGSTDADGQIASYAWDFGDGRTGTAAQGRHSYAEAGTYTATLTVTDDDGATGSAAVVVTAVAPNQPPVAAFGADCTDLVCSFDAARSTDPDGSVKFYDWDFGDGTTGAGVATTHAFQAGTYLVTLVVTDDDGAKDTIRHEVTAVEPNRAPVSAFTATMTDLTGVFDAASSSDVDGEIVSYAWDFGDGQTGSGVSPTHVFAAGDHLVTLTVTDDDGARDTISRTVTAVEPNKPPVAAFAAKVTDLTLALDAGAATDVDGKIVSYDWNFGDGNTGTGVTATHGYRTAGEYLVSLTVTDDDGATGTAAQTVKATYPIAASDTFSRTVAGSLGNAEIGGPWTVTGAVVTTSVADGSGRFSVGPARTNTYKLNSVATRDVDLAYTFWLEQMPTSSGTTVWGIPRSTATGDYRVRMNITPTGGMSAQLVRLVGSETVLVSSFNVSGTYTVNQRIRVRVQALGASPTTLRVKIWSDSEKEEPTAWLASVTDSTAGLQQAGAVGVASNLAGSFSSAVVRLDDFLATERADLAEDVKTKP